MTNDLTPMLKQYFGIKDECGDAIVFFRLGDFFEMFGEDAKIASQVLGITLTGRDAGRDGRIPMCGVPHHAAQGYIAKLLAAGFKVAVCDQVEDPKLAKGIVRREVVRIVTPGTVTDRTALTDKENNYLAAVVEKSGRWGLAYTDVSTGEFATTEIGGEGAGYRVGTELLRIVPAELLVPVSAFEGPGSREFLGAYAMLQPACSALTRLSLTPLDDAEFGADNSERALKKHFGTVSLDGFGCVGLPQAIGAAGALLGYLQTTQRTALSHIQQLRTYSCESHMTLDPATRRSLELAQNQRDGSRRDTLLSSLDRTVTAMGGRLLKSWVERPLLALDAIEERLDAVDAMAQDLLTREEVREYLQAVYDLERLVGRIGCGSGNARDLVALRDSAAVIPNVRAALGASTSSSYLTVLREELDELSDLRELIAAAIADDPPATLRDGGLIRPGFDAELDRLRTASRDGKGWIGGLEAREKEATGIRSLKVGYNKVFGYYIEVTRTNLDMVPPTYIRKQTLANGERFITPELKEFEALVLGAEEKSVDLEYELFARVRDTVAQASARIQRTAHALAQIDAVVSLAQVAVAGNYVRPRVTQADRIMIVEGRHPVVERNLPPGQFVPNDTCLDCGDNRFLLITGPNMAGKSTYLRQVALIVVMAQIGSFVPAREAEIGLVDRVFTRVGASDDLATGQSTFMVEMNEVANILHHATARSLIILDEVGRGTSTFDGLAIAWALTEYVHDAQRLGAKTLFATHYHELTHLAAELAGLKNYSVAVRKEGDQITFLRRIVPGGADESYGIEVARLAGLPRGLLVRARDVLARLNEVEVVSSDRRLAGKVEAVRPADESERDQLGLFGPPVSPVLAELSEVDPAALTPLAALTLLFRLCPAARAELARDDEAAASNEGA